jgi:uncharacterized OB-fold protein
MHTPSEKIKESANEPYEDSIARAIRAAKKAGNYEAIVYYDDCLRNHSACVSFERFKGSAAYESWKKNPEVVAAIEQTKHMNRIPSWMLEEDAQFDVKSDDHWNDEEKRGFVTKKDVTAGFGKIHFKSNTGTRYCVEMSGGKIRSVTDDRENVYDVSEIQKYWDRGFPLIGAIAATIGDGDAGPGADEEERMLLYPPTELQETDGEKEVLPRTRCEKCGQKVEPGISSRYCPRCHEKTLSAAESDLGVEESAQSSEITPPNFPKHLYEKLVIKFKGNKRKINEMMWKLHNKFGDNL